MKERVGRSIRALRRFIETSHADDDFFLIGFNDRAKLVQDFTTSGDSILGHLMFASPHGSTALYDAAYIAVENVQQGRQSKKALLIISDGQDNNSRYTYKELRNRVKEADVQVYAIGITDPANDTLARLWPLGARRDHSNDRRTSLLSERIQRAGTCRDMHSESRWSFDTSIPSGLSDRYSKRISGTRYR
jgi:VWFA-related protein